MGGKYFSCEFCSWDSMIWAKLNEWNRKASYDLTSLCVIQVKRNPSVLYVCMADMSNTIGWGIGIR